MESTAPDERAESAESTVNGERAGRNESTENGERADVQESTVPRERTNRPHEGLSAALVMAPMQGRTTQ